jgi:hypothetical protein
MDICELEEASIAKYHPSAAPIDMAELFINTRHLNAGDAVADLGAGQAGFGAVLRSRGVTVYAIDTLYADMTFMDQRFEEGIRLLQDPEDPYPLSNVGLRQIRASQALFNKDWAAHRSFHLPGKMTRLPLKSNSVKLAYALASMPLFEEEDEAFSSACIDEALRIVQFGGEFQFAPYCPGISASHLNMERKYNIEAVPLYGGVYRGVIRKL